MRAYQFGSRAPDRSRHHFHAWALVHPDSGMLHGTNMKGVLRKRMRHSGRGGSDPQIAGPLMFES